MGEEKDRQKIKMHDQDKEQGRQNYLETQKIRNVALYAFLVNIFLALVQG